MLDVSITNVHQNGKNTHNRMKYLFSGSHPDFVLSISDTSIKVTVFALEFFKNSPQYKNANTKNFVLAVPSEMNCTNEVCNLQM